MPHPDPDRNIHAMQGVGVAAHVLQGRELEILRVHVQQPALIFVDKGIKTVRAARAGAFARAMLEVMHWLLEAGIVLSAPPVTADIAFKIRTLIGASPQLEWTAVRVASEMAMSQATLRRRLAAEGSTLSELLVDIRMSTALTLLQATTQPVSHIALAVGYESPSRFAVRFRQRFGFAPTAVRGHERIY